MPNCTGQDYIHVFDSPHFPRNTPAHFTFLCQIFFCRIPLHYREFNTLHRMRSYLIASMQAWSYAIASPEPTQLAGIEPRIGNEASPCHDD